MSLQIRKATLKDLRKIVAMYGHIGDSPYDPFASVRRLKRLNLDTLLVAEWQGDFAGFLYYFIHRHPYFEPEVQDYASIDELHVRRRFWNRGIGSTLLRAAIEDVSQTGISTVYVDTDEDNYRALHVYRGIGFKALRKSVKLKLVLKKA